MFARHFTYSSSSLAEFDVEYIILGLNAKLDSQFVCRVGGNFPFDFVLQSRTAYCKVKYFLGLLHKAKDQVLKSS